MRAAADALAPGPARRTVLVGAGSAGTMSLLPGCGNFSTRLEIDPAFLMAEVAFLDTPEFATTLQDARP